MWRLASVFLSLLICAPSTVCWATCPSIRAFEVSSHQHQGIPPMQALEGVCVCVGGRRGYWQVGAETHVNTQLCFRRAGKYQPEQP